MIEQDDGSTFSEQGKGTYILILQLVTSPSLEIGRLGTFDFPAGWYSYVGSAFGSGGLRGRLKHHLSAVRRPHWHIDYLRQSAPCKEIWYTVSETVYEHDWSSVLQSLPGAMIPAPGFGASDCRCKTHLVFFEDRPDFDVFGEMIGEFGILWRTDRSLSLHPGMST